MTEILIEIVGYTGMSLCISAYALNVHGKLASDSKYYLLANGFGGMFLVLNSLWHWALPSAFENAVWAGIAFCGVGRTLTRRKKNG